jgi:hypothetical protein
MSSSKKVHWPMEMFEQTMCDDVLTKSKQNSRHTKWLQHGRQQLLFKGSKH